MSARGPQEPATTPASPEAPRGDVATPDDAALPGLGRISARTVREATGREWTAWLEALDAAGAADWEHKQIVAHLEREHPELSGWWRQSLAVGYERARGRRVLGETADAGFQVGVRRTVGLPPAEAWELVVGRPDLWLGEGAPVSFSPGLRYAVAPGTGILGARGEIRTVRPGERMRMTWHPDGWPAPANLQITITPATAGRATIGVHLDRLADAEAREAMREHWREALDRLAAEAARA